MTDTAKCRHCQDPLPKGRRTLCGSQECKKEEWRQKYRQRYEKNREKELERSRRAYRKREASGKRRKHEGAEKKPSVSRSSLRMGLPDRFWAKTRIEDAGYDTPCLTWTGYTSPDGYGRFQSRESGTMAHRAAYEALVSPIPAGMTIDHQCRNRACVNVVHMEPATQGENTLRGYSPAAIYARRTHCNKGHPFDAENTYRHPDGRRVCRACMRTRNRNYRARKDRQLNEDDFASRK